MRRTKIEYLTHTWNPIGMKCSPVSEGCANCWHLETIKRFGLINPGVRERELEAPLKLRKPARIGVQFMGDLFHPDVPFEFVLKALGVMILSPWHTYIVLTKRVDRLREFFANGTGWLIRENMKHSSYGYEFWAIESTALDTQERRLKANAFYVEHYPEQQVWPRRGILDGPVPRPIPNLWLLATCENQDRANERIPLLLDTPAAVRGVSLEPLLGPIDFRRFLLPQFRHIVGLYTGDAPQFVRPDWVIVGAETGRGARPCKQAWIDDIVRQCKEAGVPVFVKRGDGPREIPKIERAKP